MTELDRSSSEALNQNCYCIGTDAGAMGRHLQALELRHGLPASGASLFSELPVFVTAEEVREMEAVVAAVTRTVTSPAWRQALLADAPAIDQMQSSIPVFMGFDFHLSPEGPKLIEINTNAGGALLCAEGGRFEMRLAGFDSQCLIAPYATDAARSQYVDHFLRQFEHRFGRRPERIAIVDDTPAQQPLRTEFLLFQELFAAAGIAAVIVDAADLSWTGEALLANGQPVDLVYNRVTDFHLEEPAHAALASAVLSGRVMVTPDPQAHALQADKRNLARLTDPAFLDSLPVDPADRTTLLRGIPATREVHAADAERWWNERDRWFFKPVSGYGGKGTYRGSKITRKVFEQILQGGPRGGYVAQAFVPPALRGTRPEMAAAGQPLKFDIRCYAFEGHVNLLAARLYQGQTTNFRTPGGGFAPVFLVPETGACDNIDDVSCPGNIGTVSATATS